MEISERTHEYLHADQIWSRFSSCTCSLRKLPAEVRLIVYHYVAPEGDYLGKHPALLGALRPDKLLYMEFLAEFKKRSTYVLDEYKRDSFDIFCSMLPQVLESIQKLKIVYIQYHEVDELDRVGHRSPNLGWYFDKNALSKAVNVQELTWDLSSIHKDLFGAFFVSHIPEFPRLTTFNLVIHNAGTGGELIEAHELTDLDHLLRGLCSHFSNLMPKIGSVCSADFEDEAKEEFDRAFDNQEEDIKNCLIWMWSNYPWEFEVNMQRILARSRLGGLPPGGGLSEVTGLGISETWFWQAAEGETLLREQYLEK